MVRSRILPGPHLAGSRTPVAAVFEVYAATVVGLHQSFAVS
jgi:hypothetical protein